MVAEPTSMQDPTPVGEGGAAAVDGDGSAGMTVDIGGVVDALPGLVWTTGADGAGEFFNHRWSVFTGLDAELARGRGWQSAVHPDDRKSVTDALAAISTSGIAPAIEGRLQRFDGEFRWFEFRLSPLPQRGGGGDRWYWFALEEDEAATRPDHPLLDG